MKKVLHVIGGMNRAGAETMLMNLYRTIDKSRYQFDFVYYTRSDCDYDEEIKLLGGRIFYVDSSNPYSNITGIIRIIKSNGPYAAVHCHTLLNSMYPLIASKICRVRNRIVHSHSTQNFLNPTSIEKLYQWISINVIDNLGTNFISCGVKAGNYLFPKSNSNNIIILPNAISIEKFTSIKQSEIEDLKYEFQIDNKDLVIIQVARLSEVKNHKFSLDLCLKLKEEGISFKFLIVGQGPLESYLVSEVKKKHLEDCVQFLGSRDDIHNLLKISNLFLLPSLHEGFPVVLVESQVSGINCLVSSNVSDEVDQGVNLVHFEDLNSSINVWYKKIVDILNSHNKLSKEERLNKLSAYDVNSSALRLCELYDN